MLLCGSFGPQLPGPHSPQPWKDSLSAAPTLATRETRPSSDQAFTVNMLVARCQSKIGGQTDVLIRMEGLFHKFYGNYLKRHEKGLSNLLAILLSGPSGVGKLHLARTFAGTHLKFLYSVLMHF